MKPLIPILCLVLAACAPSIVDTRPPDKIDVAPVARAVNESVIAAEKVDASVKEVRKATDAVKEANAKSSELTKRLSEQIARTKIIAAGNVEFQESIAETERIIQEIGRANMTLTTTVETLNAKVGLLEFDNATLGDSNSRLSGEVTRLKEAKAKQDIQIAETGEKLLSAAKIQSRYDTLKEEKSWWMWAAWITWIAAGIIIAGFICVSILLWKARKLAQIATLGI